ncbi:MAG: DUF4303 domain-containing protein [Pirellulaceae bacterium]|nr:DUF4303 domain-containing protein [Pirellulaceae bacterium]
MTCGKPIRTRTAEKNGGLCAICLRDCQRPHDWQDALPLPSDSIEFEARPDVAAILAGNAIVWDAVEETLVELASRYISLFAETNRDRSFYGFAFDCNADYGEVFICANSPQGLRDRAIECKGEWPDLYGSQTLDEIANDLRWSLGDWEFNAFTTESFSDSWQPVANVLSKAIDWRADGASERHREAFLNCICRAMLRLEANGALDALSQTNDFKTFVSDHDESADDSWSRYDAIREHLKVGQ